MTGLVIQSSAPGRNPRTRSDTVTGGEHTSRASPGNPSTTRST
jgi:hypothetical protein